MTEKGNPKDQTQIKQTLDDLIRKLSSDHVPQVFFKTFLKPVQITLKNQPHKSALPIGVQLVNKESIDDNKFTLQNFESPYQINSPVRLNLSKQNVNESPNNLISLLKSIRPQFCLKVAICVCMYNEDREMLKRTLQGIQKNIITFVNRGISYNEIGVFVIIDGIQTVHQSVQKYFEELEKDCNIFFNEEIKQLDLDALEKPNKIYQQNNENSKIEADQQIDDEQIMNFNHILFDEQEKRQFKQRRFQCRREQYSRWKRTIEQIKKIQSKRGLNYQSDIQGTIFQSFYLDIAREQYKRENHYINQMFRDDIILKQYSQSYAKSNPICKEALNEARKYCEQYVSSRDNLALMSCFRVPITNFKKGKRIEQIQQNYFKIPKMNLFMVTKYKNRGKLSSHNWFINGFCCELNPKYAILLDVGVVPEKQALWKMYEQMESPKNEDVGGVCGYMQLRIQPTKQHQRDKDLSLGLFTSFFTSIFDIQRAQQFQYHYAHLINKPFESIFDFIHVLPGAFSGYRMQALRKKGQKDSQLLKHYFKSVEDNKIDSSYRAYPYTTCQTVCKVLLPDFIYRRIYDYPDENSYERILYDKNIYLAEDRILCMGIHSNGYKLKFLPDSTAWVDPVKNIHDFLVQRRRWINGSLFAFDKVRQCTDIQKKLNIQIFFLTLIEQLGYIAPGIFMYSCHLAARAVQKVFLEDILSMNYCTNLVGGIFTYLIDFIYVMVTLKVIMLSMHLPSKNLKLKSQIYKISTIYGFFSYCAFTILIYDIIVPKTSKIFCIDRCVSSIQQVNRYQLSSDFRLVFQYLMAFIIILYTLPTLFFAIFKKGNHIVQTLVSTPSFIFYSQTYLNTLNIFAHCKIDDVSWGTKGLDQCSLNNNLQMTEEWKRIKTIHVFKFIFYNVLAAFLLMLTSISCQLEIWVPFSFAFVVALTLFVRVFLGIIYILAYRCSCNRLKYPNNPLFLQADDELEVEYRKAFKDVHDAIDQQLKNLSINLPKNRKMGLKQIMRSNVLYKQVNTSIILNKRPLKMIFKPQSIAPNIFSKACDFPFSSYLSHKTSLEPYTRGLQFQTENLLTQKDLPNLQNSLLYLNKKK